MIQADLSALPARLREKIYIEPNSGCWLWVGWCHPRYGYGRLWGPHHRKSFSAHSVVFSFFGGVVPEGKELDHLCRTRCCCNPSHLEAVTRRQNLLRGNTFAARHQTKTYCIRGHPFDERNTYFRARKEGGRQCRACRAEYERLRRKKRVKSSSQ